ncbi:hypothetical protein MSPP1_004243 [Malassezia sp. CBS 17886]|nr:hypothetical protein MSPP1_004243 [Malassezia sp. CBS 17886]
MEEEARGGILGGTVDNAVVRPEAESDKESGGVAPANEISPHDPSIPDGGFLAWLQVAGSFTFFFNAWGLANSFGTFQTYYISRYPDQSASNISLIGSIQCFLLFLTGALTGPLFDMGYFYYLETVGAFLVVFGMMMTSLTNSYWQVMLSQGLCVGIGSGCLFLSGVGIAATYFSSKRALALGISAGGSSIGAVVYSIVFHRLEPRIGFRYATVVIGFISLGTLSFALAVLRPRLGPSPKRSLFAFRALREPPYGLFCVGVFLGFVGLYVPFFYISSYAMKKVHMGKSLSFYLVTILNAGSFGGRILPNFVADKTGTLNVMVPSTIICAILSFAWLGIFNNAGLIVFSVLYGFVSGTFVSLPPAVVAALTHNLHHVGSRIGTMFTFCAFGVLMGTPVAGVLVDLKNASFWKAELFGAMFLLGSGIFMFLARQAKVGLSLGGKA